MAGWLSRAVLVALILYHGTARAQVPEPDQGKLLATGGVSELEGAGGGGLTPWALITGYGSDDSYGANLHMTGLRTRDDALVSEGAAVALWNRIEVSFANERLSITDGALKGTAVREQITGLKLSLLGDAVYAQDSLVPQVAIGVQYHQNKGISGLEALGIARPTSLGATHNNGTDYYLSATKIFLNQSLLLNGTLRLTDANEFGLLGYGGDRNNGQQVMFEGSVAYLISRHWVAGLEFRQRPHNLSVDDERAAYDAFLAWLPSHNFSLTMAWVSLGTVLKPFEPREQNGLYLSSQIGF